MRRSILTTGLAVALGFAVIGCDEMQYEDAVEDYNEDVTELEQERQGAMQDGILDSEEAEEIQDQREDVIESAGEVAEQQGDLIESKTDDL